MIYVILGAIWLLIIYLADEDNIFSKISYIVMFVLFWFGIVIIFSPTKMDIRNDGIIMVLISIASFFLSVYISGKRLDKYLEEEERQRKRKEKAEAWHKERELKEKEQLDALNCIKRTELLGMNYAKHYLTSKGYHFTDVSTQNLGYDIIYFHDGLEVSLEVKALSGEGDVLITPNEFEKMKSLKDKYALYVSMNCSRSEGFSNVSPDQYLLENPIEKVNFFYDRDKDRYVLSKNQIYIYSIKE